MAPRVAPPELPARRLRGPGAARRPSQKLDGDVVFYLATAPDLFGPIIHGLADADLLDEASGLRRVVIEKPFGTDLASARALSELLLARTREEQI